MYRVLRPFGRYKAGQIIDPPERVAKLWMPMGLIARHAMAEPRTEKRVSRKRPCG